MQVGQRLHYVLNSLSADFITCLLALLAEGGAFCEIGKRSVWSVLRQRAAIGAGVCHTIALDVDMADDPQWMQGVLSLLSRRAASGATHALPLQSYDLARGYEAAFRSLLGGSSTGKVVLCVGQAGMAVVCVSGESHLLTGGTGGLGLLTARWLAQQGAGSVVLSSRSGMMAAGGPASGESEQLHASGARVLVERCDAGEAVETSRLVAAVRAANLPREASNGDTDGRHFGGAELRSCITGEGEPPLELKMAAVACAASGPVWGVPVEQLP